MCFYKVYIYKNVSAKKSTLEICRLIYNIILIREVSKMSDADPKMMGKPPLTNSMRAFENGKRVFVLCK